MNCSDTKMSEFKEGDRVRHEMEPNLILEVRRVEGWDQEVLVVVDTTGTLGRGTFKVQAFQCQLDLNTPVR
jgi:hypothetical protein